MTKVSILQTSKGKRFVFHCPGCKVDHCVDESWGFNGDLGKPTFTPSVLYREFGEGDKVTFTCHFYVKHGMIEYLSDCSHELKGKTVDMVDRK